MDSPTRKVDRLLAEKGLEFTLNLYEKIAANSTENIFISPFSISLALAMTFAGAKENTAKQMKHVLKFESFKTDAAVHESFQKVLIALLGLEISGIKLHIANRMYVHDKAIILPHYRSKLEKHYNSTSSRVGFSKDAENIRLEINQWVEDQTRNKIKDLITPGILTALTRLVLVNAIYFKGNWQEVFDPESTMPDYFFLDVETAIMTDLMHKTSEFNYVEDDNLQCQIIELPYVNEALSMFIILPSQISGLKMLENSLNASNLRNAMSRMRKTKVILTLPILKIESAFSLKDVLSEMGMSDLFLEEKADLSGITEEKGLFVSAILHKAVLEVNEEGSEAAAATSVLIMERCMPIHPEFRGDHPFILFIQDNRSGCILFWGRVVNPNLEAGIQQVPTELRG